MVEPTEVPEEWAAALRALTADLDSETFYSYGWRPAPDRGPAVASYVLTGEPADALSLIGRHDEAPLRLASRPTAERAGPVTTLFRDDALVGAVPAAVWTRWFAVLDAAVFAWNARLPPIGGGRWVEGLLRELSVASLDADEEITPRVSLRALDRLLHARGSHVAEVVWHAFAWEPEMRRDYRWNRRPWLLLQRMRGYDDLLIHAAEWLGPRLTTGPAEARAHAVWMIAAAGERALEAYAGPLAEAAAAASVQVRDAAIPVALRLGEAVDPRLRTLATEGKPEQRAHAFRLLWELGGDERRAFVRQQGAADRAATVREAVAALEESPARATLPDWWQLPEVATVRWQVQWTAEVEEVIGRVAAMTMAFRTTSAGLERLTADEVLGLVREQLTDTAPGRALAVDRVHVRGLLGPLLDGSDGPALEPSAAVQLHVVLHENDGYSSESDLQGLVASYLTAGRLTLDELAAMLDTLGVDGPAAVLAMWSRSPTRGGVLERGAPEEWPDEAVWPFFARHLDRAAAEWRERRNEGRWGYQGEAFLRAVGRFPEPPPMLVDEVVGLALGSGTTLRRAAQDSLHRLDALVARVCVALGDRSADSRAVSAEWLARLGDQAAVVPLEHAVRRETHDVAKAAMLDALVAFGKRVEDYVDRDTLDAQATKALAKGLPSSLSWLDQVRLPPVRWADSGAELPRDTMLHLLVQSAKTKSPEPNALLRTYAGMLDPASRAWLGDAVLDQWLEAGAPAAAKGVLGVVATGGTAASVAASVRYIRTWHGQRAVQSKALVAMLATHDHVSAAEALVAIAYRFNAPSIQKAATAAVEELAERRGWTLEELGDRAIPGLGFDDRGEQEVSFGERSFTLRLLPDLKVVVRDQDGVESATLPPPRKADEPESVKAAKSTLATVKKGIKQTVATQTERLHGALVAQRTWSAEAWLRDLAGHPLARHLVARLVWRAEQDGQVRGVRLMDDGTLTDVADETVVLAPHAELRIAHASTLPDDEVAAWREHLVDFEVVPLFPHLDRPLLDLDEAQRSAMSLDAADGATLGSFELRGRATRLGYRRGPVGDGASFDCYVKPFPDVGLAAVVDFDGDVWVPEDAEVEVTMRGLRFEGDDGQPVALADVPPVLLSEAWHDLQVISGSQVAS